MSALAEIYIKKETLDILCQTLSKKTGDDAKGIKVQVSFSDETNTYGQNVSAQISQTKEQREQKVKPFYIGNGKVFWTNGSISIAAKKEEFSTATTQKADDSEMPF